MSNQRTTQLNQITEPFVTDVDIISISDVSDLGSPTGATKKVELGDLLKYSEIITQFKPTNGLVFDQSVVHGSDENLCCFSPSSTLPTEFSISVHAFVSPYPKNKPTGNHKIIFGASDRITNAVDSLNSAYIGIKNTDLIWRVRNGMGVIEQFFEKNVNLPFCATLCRDAFGNVTFYVNGIFISSVRVPGPILDKHYVMGCGNQTDPNIDMILYSAHVHPRVLQGGEVQAMIDGKFVPSGSVSSYREADVNPVPSQWLDNVGGNHLLTPVSGAFPLNPTKEFHLRFYATASGYLGCGQYRQVLPRKSVIENARFTTTANSFASFSIGASSSLREAWMEGETYATTNNRMTGSQFFQDYLPVPIDLELRTPGLTHWNRALYVDFNHIESPCTFSFDGFIADYTEMPYPPDRRVYLQSGSFDPILLQDGTEIITQQ